eukprot:TRINITY_DN12301_c0_g1_i1.p1 TRINITY_DN12301_c0_g1~~TRINITY_DN12301_c0_g1_i1.p1  ORF type:complete len:216 (+),score=80.19 TRINITY_DN12301_c0_g1_i1:69-716(+)
MNEVRGDGIETVVEIPTILRDFAKEVRRAKVDNIDWFYDFSTRYFAELAGCDVSGESVAERNCMLPLKPMTKNTTDVTTDEKENEDKEAAARAYESAEAARIAAEELQQKGEEAEKAKEREQETEKEEEAEKQKEKEQEEEREKEKEKEPPQEEQAPEDTQQDDRPELEPIREQPEQEQEQAEDSSSAPITSVRQTPVVPFDYSNNKMNDSCLIC